MNRLRKIIFWTAVFIIGFWLILPLILSILDLEFATDSLESNYQVFMLFVVPIAILLTLFGTIKDNDDGSTIAAKTIFTCLVVAVLVFLMVTSILGDMCARTTRKVLFENKNDSSTKIIVSDFGCGATDSGPAIVGVYKVRYFTDYFIRYTKVDTATIDKNEWIKME